MCWEQSRPKERLQFPVATTIETKPENETTVRTQDSQRRTNQKNKGLTPSATVTEPPRGKLFPLDKLFQERSDTPWSMGPEQIWRNCGAREVWRTEAGCANHPGYFGRSGPKRTRSRPMVRPVSTKFRRRSTSEWIFLPRMFTSPTTRCLSPRTGLMIRSSSLPIWTTPLAAGRVRDRPVRPATAV